MGKKLEVVSIRLVEEQPLMSSVPIRTPSDAVQLLGEHMCSLDREVLCVINLRSDGKPVCCNFVSMGAVNESVAHPREILKSAILSNAASMIMIHNHPSGNLTPSKADTIVTARMLKTCELIGIPLIDHIIVGGNNEQYFSFHEKEMLDFEHNKFESNYENLTFPMQNVAEDCAALTEAVPRKRRGR